MSNVSRTIFVTSFFPADDIGRGPWSERYNGLYRKIFEGVLDGDIERIWYAVAERREYRFLCNEVTSNPRSLFAFLVENIRGIAKNKLQVNFLISYPATKARDIGSSLLLLMFLGLVRYKDRVNTVVDFVDPPSLMTRMFVKGSIARKCLSSLRAWEEKAYLRLARTIVVNSSENAEVLRRKYKLQTASILSIPMGISVSRFPVDPARCRRRKFTVFYGGVISQDRGLLELFACLERVNTAHPVDLLCCGRVQGALEIPDHPWLSVYNDLDFDAYVELLTTVADIGIIPYPNNEWWGKVSISKLATYAAAGIPILATRLSHTERFLNDTNSGRVADSWEHMDEWILQLHEDRDLCLTMGQNAREAAEQRLDWSRLAERLGKVIEG